MSTVLFSFIYYLIRIRDFYFTLDPAYMDLLKIFAGCIGWVGGLALFMWIREKKKMAALSVVRGHAM